MNNYILNTRSAAKGIIELLGREKKLLLQKQTAFESMKDSAFSLFNGMQKTRFEPTGIIELFEIESAKDQFVDEVKEITDLISILSSAYNTLAGALLQIAKQGISYQYGNLSTCPTGRVIGNSEALKNVVWQGRNQSMHYEEGNFNRNVQGCFHNLSSDFGNRFNLGTHNLALAIIDLLGWNTYSDYEKDMKILLP